MISNKFMLCFYLFYFVLDICTVLKIMMRASPEEQKVEERTWAHHNVKEHI